MGSKNIIEGYVFFLMTWASRKMFIKKLKAYRNCHAIMGEHDCKKSHISERQEMEHF